MIKELHYKYYVLLDKIVNQIKKDLRDYQQECIDLIKNTKGNLILCLPTGTGKNFIIIHSNT